MTLHVENLTVHHGAIQALTSVSFDVKEGELTAVIGSNGAGKSTLLRTLSGLKSATT
jgi:branched-chain amino acid transport system ATP-binding protein